MKHKQIQHTNWYEQYIDLINQGLSQRKACEEMGVPRSTIQHWLAERDVCDVILENHKEVVDETAYLLSSPKNAKRLMESVAQLTKQPLNIMKDKDADPHERLKAANHVLSNLGSLDFGQDGIVDFTNESIGVASLIAGHVPNRYTVEDVTAMFNGVKLNPYEGVVEHDNQRILLISDMHIPYHHPNTLAFLSYLKAKYKPTRVICLGDELDGHSLSYHEKSPELPSAMDELSLALPTIAELHNIFPKMDILESNHGSLVYRKTKTHGIPKHYIKSYNDILGVDDGWKWHFDLMITLPDGNKCYLHHGKSARCLQLAEKMGCCAVEGHYHNSFSIEYYGTPFALNWAMQVGCLVDFKSLAFSYANVNIKRPIIGTGLIIDSQPVLAPMLLDEDGNWIRPQDYDVVIGV